MPSHEGAQAESRHFRCHAASGPGEANGRRLPNATHQFLPRALSPPPRCVQRPGSVCAWRFSPIRRKPSSPRSWRPSWSLGIATAGSRISSTCITSRCASRSTEQLSRRRCGGPFCGGAHPSRRRSRSGSRHPTGRTPRARLRYGRLRGARGSRWILTRWRKSRAFCGCSCCPSSMTYGGNSLRKGNGCRAGRGDEQDLRGAHPFCNASSPTRPMRTPASAGWGAILAVRLLGIHATTTSNNMRLVQRSSPVLQEALTAIRISRRPRCAEEHGTQTATRKSKSGRRPRWSAR
jgi:hypothetical protein